jgi:outer membrane protein OmpA-like peptidoglycan-associated protein
MGAGPGISTVSTILGTTVGGVADVAVCSYMAAQADKLRTCTAEDTVAAAAPVPPAHEEDNPFDIAEPEKEEEAVANVDQAEETEEVEPEDGMDRLAGDLGGADGQGVDGARVERVGEGVWITFDSQLLFGFDSEALRTGLHGTLRTIAATLNGYPETKILVIGHTDSVGPEEYNKILSRKRAGAVADFLRTAGVDDERVTEVGRGEEQPVATNATREGRRANRRVEIAVYANEELKRAALEGMISGTLRPDMD